MLRSVGSHVKRPLCHGFARSTNNHLFEYRLSFKSVGLGSVLIANARIKRVRYRSHATYSRQPRQVRKEATVTGSCVCSESPVPDLIFSTANLPEFATLWITRFYIPLLLFLRRKWGPGPSIEVST